MQLQQEAQAQANRFTQEMNEAVEKEVALVAGAENQSRLVDARASDRGMPAANENVIVGSRGPVAPSRRPVTRQAQYVSRRNINPGARYLIRTQTPVLQQKFNRSIRSGHHVYMYHDGKGRLLYAGKSGGVTNHADWVQRLQRDHMRSAWIDDARSVTVFYDLSEQEMWALEEVMIGRDPTGRVSGTFYALFNERPGEYTMKFGEQGLGANASSAMKKPSARFSFFADPLPR
jgi:hypothetical protein